MKHIKSLHIINFQSHENTFIHLDKGLNIFVGESDQGKTAIIRAIRWLLYNEPRGSGFIRVGENRCEVSAVLDNGTQVTRLRDEGKRQNRYIINYHNGDELILEGFGNVVPLEVQKEFGIYPLEIDSDLKLELNIARQLEAPFLIDKSPANKAKIIGRIANLHIIDAAQRNLLRDIRGLSQRNNELEVEIEELNESKLDYADIPHKEKLLQEMKTKMNKLETSREQYKLIDIIKNQKVQLDAKIKENEEKLDKLKDLEIIEGLHQKTLDKFNYYQELLILNENRKSITSKLNKQKNTINGLENLDNANFIYNKLRDLTKLINELIQLNINRHKCKQNLVTFNNYLANTAQLYRGDELINKLFQLRQEGFELQQIRRVSRQITTDTSSLKEELLSTRAKLAQLKGVEEAESIIIGQRDKLTTLQALLAISEERKLLGKQLNQTLNNIIQLENDYKKLQAEFIKTLGEAESCPTCGSQITREIISEIADKTAI